MQATAEPLQLKPALIERPWAGHRLVDVMSKQATQGVEIGESWEVSDHRTAQSGFVDPVHSAKTFGDLYRENSRDVFDLPRPTAPYPLLVKFIDAGENLSIQVHPDDNQAEARGIRGKSECWYVIDAPPEAHVLCGFTGEVTPEKVRESARTGDFDELLVRRPVRKGTFVNVPAGTVHAILKGTLVCEISQSSSEIARLWDWGRPAQEGRRIDIETALEFADFRDAATRPQSETAYSLETDGTQGVLTLVRNRHFEVKLVSSSSSEGEQDLVLENPHGVVLSVVEGSGIWRRSESSAGSLKMGQTWFLPAHLTNLKVGALDGELKLLASRPLRFS